MKDLLDNVTIAKPCSASWNAMDGDDRKRFCASCRLHVYNVAGLDRAEANALVATGDKVCLRIYRREDGTVLTKDCPVGVRATAGGTTAFALLTAAFCLACLNILSHGLMRARSARPNALTALARPVVDSVASFVDTAKMRVSSRPKLDAVASQPLMGSN